jgi:hypothetical protein
LLALLGGATIVVVSRLRVKWLQEGLMAVIKLSGWQPNVHRADRDLHNRRGEAAADLVRTSYRQRKNGFKMDDNIRRNPECQGSQTLRLYCTYYLSHAGLDLYSLWHKFVQCKAGLPY